MEMHQLRYFLAIADTGNFTRAAEQCHVSQPSLSQQIIKLEEEVGHKLFDRMGRRVQLTDAGRLLLEHARSVLTTVENATRQLRETRGQGFWTTGDWGDSDDRAISPPARSCCIQAGKPRCGADHSGGLHRAHC